MTKNIRKTLQQWLSWMEACHPTDIELGLDRVRQVYTNLNLDLSQSTVVTVAGTNGKGSTVSYLRQIYSDAGLSVGCYTSPHFLVYNERVTLNGEQVSDDQLCAAFALIDQARGDISLTYFEFGTLAAIVIFVQTKPDLVLLEVGLGGRLDAVNIIDADLSVVTTVAIDHIDWLGDDRNQIGYEKAGVYRSNKPAICGDLNPPPSIADHCKTIGAYLLQANADFKLEQHEDSWDWTGVGLQGQAINITNIPHPSLPLQNASTALQVVAQLPFTVSESQLKTSIQKASLTGRMQLIKQAGIHYWLDVAHNPEAAAHLKVKIEALDGKKSLVIGMLSDKDCTEVLDSLVTSVNDVNFVTLDVPRGQSAQALSGFINTGVNSRCFDDVATALETLKNDSVPSNHVIIAGSFFTVSDALSVLSNK